MSRSTFRRVTGVGTVALSALLTATLAAGPATADPDPSNPGTPPAGVAAAKVIAGVGADADAELIDNVAAKYNAAKAGDPNTLASYDAINPQTGVAGETITTKPGCSLARPNGANAGIKALLNNQTSTTATGVNCIDFARSSRAKDPTSSAEANLDFYALAQDAVDWVAVGGAYAPRTPLTDDQLISIFTCQTTNWADVGGQYGPIHVYTPPESAATYTFFLQAIGTTVGDVDSGCGGSAGTAGSKLTLEQQNDGATIGGDPEGIAPYAVSKWAAQSNLAPGTKDLRGGTVLGRIQGSATTAPTAITTATQGGTTYTVLNPTFASDGTQGRLLYDVTRNTAPASQSSDIFGPSGFICSNAAALLVPFGATPLSTTVQPTCGQKF